MERLGCRFWAWDAEVIPTLPQIVVEPLQVDWRPPFAMHDLMSREALTGRNDFVHKIRAKSPVQFTGNHNLQPMLREFAEANPKEVFPLVKRRDKETGKVLSEERKFNNLHYCYTAPGMAEALATALEKEVEKRGGNVKNFIYFAGMGDWYGGVCECPRCEAVYAEEAWTNPDGRETRGLAGTLLRMINRTAEILEKKDPGIMVGTFAYMTLEAPPAVTVPRDNVVIYVPRLRHCARTVVNDPAGGNRRFWLNLSRWLELAPGRVYVWEYGVNYTNLILPYPALRVIAANIKAYHQAGLHGLMIQGNYSSEGGDAVVMNNWVWSRLMRDPSLDTEALIQEFTDGYYGPAGAEVRAYLKELEKSWQAPDLGKIDEFSDPVKTYLTPGVVASLQKRLEMAKGLVQGPEHEVYLERLKDLALSVAAARLWPDGPLREMDGRYVRADLGPESYDQALEISRHPRRKAPPNEYSNGVRAWLALPAKHGGPVATLREGKLSAKVWPAQGLVGPVRIGHFPVFTSTTEDRIAFAEFDDENRTGRLSFSGVGGLSAWDTAPTAHYRKEVEILDENTMQLTYHSRGLGRATSAMHHLTTAYPFRVTEKGVRVWVLDSGGHWNETPLPTGGGPSKQVNLTNVHGLKVETPRFQITDTWDMLVETSEKVASPKRPHRSGFITQNSKGEMAITVNLQADGLNTETDTPTIQRTVHMVEVERDDS
jgi:hypothetical protein